jgi:hypothetical protein
MKCLGNVAARGWNGCSQNAVVALRAAPLAELVKDEVDLSQGFVVGGFTGSAGQARGLGAFVGWLLRRRRRSYSPEGSGTVRHQDAPRSPRPARQLEHSETTFHKAVGSLDFAPLGSAQDGRQVGFIPMDEHNKLPIHDCLGFVRKIRTGEVVA